MHVKSEHQLADLFTKAVQPSVFKTLMFKMGIHRLFIPSWGGGVLELLNWIVDMIKPVNNVHINTDCIRLHFSLSEIYSL